MENLNFLAPRDGSAAGGMPAERVDETVFYKIILAFFSGSLGKRLGLCVRCSHWGVSGARLRGPGFQGFSFDFSWFFIFA